MDELRKQAEQLQNKIRNYLDQPKHAHAQTLTREVDNLILDIRAKKHPLSIENRIKQVIKHLEAFTDDTIMDYRHIDEIIQHSNNMRQATQKL
jgi:molecular chaperone DnaK (HSP70)